MNRLSRTLIALPVGLVLAGLAACSSTTSGAGNGNLASASAASSAPSSADTPTGSGSGSSSGSSAPASQVTVTSVTTSTSSSHVAPPPPPPAPAFETLGVSFKNGDACAPQGGVTTVDLYLTWKVAHATGIEVSIDNTSKVGAMQYPMASGSVVVTSVSCTGTNYTFDVWTTGGANGQQAHRQLKYTSPDPNK